MKEVNSVLAVPAVWQHFSQKVAKDFHKKTTECEVKIQSACARNTSYTHAHTHMCEHTWQREMLLFYAHSANWEIGD
jgi:hypothetical protein